MYRFNLASVLVFGVVATANAGQIQIGGTNGITSSYISTNCAIANCLNAPAATGISIASGGNATEINYNTTLFNGAQNSSVSPSVPATLTDTSAAAVAAAGAGGVKFNLINDASNISANAWNVEGSPSVGPADGQVLDIPVNVLGATSVWTMLNLDNGMPGSREGWVTFDFASTPGATTGLTSVTVKLLNSANGFSAVASGMLQDAILCSATCPTNIANGPTLAGPSNQNTLEDTGGLNSGTPNTAVNSQVTEYGSTLFSDPYNSGGTGTAGNVVLDDQGFVFSGAVAALAGSDYLVDVRIYDNSATGTSSTALSAITTVTSTPEPTTMLLLLTGLGAIGFARLRRRA
jgi:hypothetical protein